MKLFPLARFALAMSIGSGLLISLAAADCITPDAAEFEIPDFDFAA